MGADDPIVDMALGCGVGVGLEGKFGAALDISAVDVVLTVDWELKVMVESSVVRTMLGSALCSSLGSALCSSLGSAASMRPEIGSRLIAQIDGGIGVTTARDLFMVSTATVSSEIAWLSRAIWDDTNTK
jgi:hypothetical protein